ncbi:hypothetical protein DUNSADRAFT_16464 [Dunaliella salina]|uniref:Encoded protein n=1 Tax=Dunaliella salina TaxID=3046 RepID=A0ABQ7H0Z6_DUNSA|nr:hypothetical protein DUNSADRAFT_16464 [Dunaliella salina]|eukprot:KAF5840524.1 hypothetical protein DUNSADRAFT_16464 [Dunaliella salina]
MTCEDKQQSDIHNAQRQAANELMEDHLPLALLDQLRGARPPCTLHPHQHPVVPPTFHQLPFSQQQQQQQQPLFPPAPPPLQIPRSSAAASSRAAAGSAAANSAAVRGAAAGSAATSSAAAVGGAAVGGAAVSSTLVRGAATSSTPECRAAVCSAAVSRYTLRGMEGRRGQQLALAACPDALAGRVTSG